MRQLLVIVGSVVLGIMVALMVGTAWHTSLTRNLGEQISPNGFREVTEDICDNDKDMVLIRANRGLKASFNAKVEDDIALVDILSNVQKWQEMYPDRKLISSCFITGQVRGYTITTGYLIHYKTK